MGRSLEIDTPDGPAEAYLARPDDGDHRGVLLFVDAIGLTQSGEILVRSFEVAGDGTVRIL